MSAAQRRKGAAGELEVVALLHEHGWMSARRSLVAGGGQRGGDITGGPSGVSFEVKRCEALRLRAAWRQAAEAAGESELPVVCHRWSTGEWLAILPLGALLDRLAVQERS